MKHSIALAVAAAVLALGGCGGSDKNPGGVTQEESDQLNNAAEMLDTSPDSLTAPAETGLDNGEDVNAETSDLPAPDGAANNAIAPGQGEKGPEE